jgi:AcrR family transcriptional regulator
MPKEVDHAARRRELAQSVWRVVANEGLERATIRRIAQETGWSPGVLAHYFSDKEDMLLSSLRLCYEEIHARIAGKLEGLSGMNALRELIHDNLPLDEQRQLETRFLMNYWSREIRERHFSDHQIDARPAMVEVIAGFVREGQLAGEITCERAADDIAETLLGLIDGFSLHALLNPERLTPERQVALIDEELSRIRPRPTAAGSHRGISPSIARRSHA